MKKLITMVICFVMAFSLNGTAYAEEGAVTSTIPYVEEVTIHFNNSPVELLSLEKLENEKTFKKANYANQALTEMNAQGFEIDATTVDNLLDDLVTEEGNLLAVSMKNVYCTEGVVDGEFESRLMTESEVELLKANSGIAVSSLIGTYYDSVGKLTLTTSVSTKEVSGCDLAYLVATTATWSVMGTNGELYPAPGPDAICVSWGGDFYRNESSASLTSFAGNPISTSETGYESNKGYGWQFEDSGVTSTSSSSLKKAVCRLVLTRNHAQDEMTEIFVTYTHTYEDIDLTFSVGPSFDGKKLSGGVSVTPETVTKFWHIVLNIPRITY